MRYFYVFDNFAVAKHIHIVFHCVRFYGGEERPLFYRRKEANLPACLLRFSNVLSFHFPFILRLFSVCFVSFSAVCASVFFIHSFFASTDYDLVIVCIRVPCVFVYDLLSFVPAISFTPPAKVFSTGFRRRRHHLPSLPIHCGVTYIPFPIACSFTHLFACFLAHSHTHTHTYSFARLLTRSFCVASFHSPNALHSD